MLLAAAFTGWETEKKENYDRGNNRFVKKTLSLPAWLAAKAEEDGMNCSKLFQKALMEYLHV